MLLAQGIAQAQANLEQPLAKTLHQVSFLSLQISNQLQEQAAIYASLVRHLALMERERLLLNNTPPTWLASRNDVSLLQAQPMQLAPTQQAVQFLATMEAPAAALLSLSTKDRNPQEQVGPAGAQARLQAAPGKSTSTSQLRRLRSSQRNSRPQSPLQDGLDEE
jgi:hypothetical protein